MIRETTIESDRYPIIIMVGLPIEYQDPRKVQGWAFNTAEWEKFRDISDKEIGKN